METLTNYGLITLGSDAWQAKGQNPINDSIVLIHGNGNEPYGIRRFLELLKLKQKEIEKQSWSVYDLSYSLKEYFKSSK